MIDLVLVLSAILLIPIVPAILLYMLLPSSTTVQGPFKGLSIRLTGSFGGYFLLVLIAVGVSLHYLQEEKKMIAQQPKLEEWDVRGTLNVEELEHPPKKEDFRVVFAPIHYDVFPEENNVGLDVKVLVGRNYSKNKDKLNLPFSAVIVEYRGSRDHHPQTIYLNEEKAKTLGQEIQYKMNDKKINLGSILEMHKY